MNKKSKKVFTKEKRTAAAVVVCFVGVLAITGTLLFQTHKGKGNIQLAKENLKENVEENVSEDLNKDVTEDLKENASASSVIPAPHKEAPAACAEKDVSANTPVVSAPNLQFSEESTLEWPASGSVIMGYSMDQTVFFKTLDQYQYNPALIISGEVGEPICASAAGTVSQIEEDAQTGVTVTLDMGNGYSALYGQLGELNCAVGDYLEAGKQIGLLNEPTKYYSLEGPNLYFQILKDGNPVDPLDFME